MKTAPGYFPAGRYWIGDPCYAIPTDRWSEFLDQTGFEGGPCRAWGYDLWFASTAYGDGEYRSNKGKSFGVDAGIIGVLPEALVTSDDESLGMWVDFSADFSAELYDDHTFRIGDVEIYTEYEDEEDF